MCKEKEPLRKIEDILDSTFSIPAYQRGYRWSEREVKALLDDIWDFKQRYHDGFYCLQPLMLKKTNNHYNVIDGQQRLTTLYLLLQSLGHKKLFTLRYDSRDSLEKMLNGTQKIHEIKDKTPDNYCIEQARAEINKWFKDNKAVDKEDFLRTLLQETKLIWYETDDKQSEQDSFDHLNRGKIPLTSAELLKGALLLAKELPAEDKALLGTEWDNIEHFLQRQEVWGFISQDTDKVLGRIELLFEIYLHVKDNSIYKKFSVKKETPWIYDGIMELLEQKKDYAQLWKDIKSYARQIEYLYNDITCYHYIGFLMYQGYSIKKVFKDITNKPKSSLQQQLKEKISNTFKENDVTKANFTQKSYQDSKDKAQIQTLLLLFNVLTCLNGPAKERFPFHLYTKNQWSLEHILAQHPEDLKRPKDKTENAWYKLLLSILAEEVECAINSKDLEENSWGNTIAELSQANEDNHWTEQETEKLEELKKEISEKSQIHYIYNLALLDKASNSSLSNHVFSEKVDQIKDFCENMNKFIPPATKNVFLKFYSKGVEQFNKWTQTDRMAYKKVLEDTLCSFLPEGNDL